MVSTILSRSRSPEGLSVLLSFPQPPGKSTVLTGHRLGTGARPPVTWVAFLPACGWVERVALFSPGTGLTALRLYGNTTLLGVLEPAPTRCTSSNGG